MTYVEKHQGISDAIAAGRTNEQIASEFGVSRGMVQKHRSGETVSGGAGNCSPSSGKEPMTEREREQSEWRRGQEHWKILEELRQEEAFCTYCWCWTVHGRCDRCGRNKWREFNVEFPYGSQCPVCKEGCRNAYCADHGDYLNCLLPNTRQESLSRMGFR